MLTAVSDTKAVSDVAKGLKDLSAVNFTDLSKNMANLDENAIEKVRKFMDAASLLSGNSIGVIDTVEAVNRLTQIDFTGFNAFADAAPQRFNMLSTSLAEFVTVCGNIPGFDAAISNLERLSNINLPNIGQIHVHVPDISGAINEETQHATAILNGWRTDIGNLLNMNLGNSKLITNIFDSITGAVKLSGKAISAYTSLVGKAFGLLGDAATKLGTKLAVIPRSFLRIAKYRFIRTIIKQITNGFKEGTDNLYQYSKAIDGRFAKSMDTLATSALYFRNSIGASTAPIINALAPAIDLLVDKIVVAINKFNELTARITGASTWTKALKYPKEYAKATDDATKKLKTAQKAAKDFSMGFDELNVINDKDNDLASSLTDADEDKIDYSKMFEEMNTTGGFIKSLDQLFDEIPWEEYGRKVGDGINSVVDKIRDVLEGNDFHKLGKGFADFFNGMFDSIKWDSIGIAFADGLNTVLAIWNGFVSNFKFDEFGTDLSQFFNGFVGKINIDELAVNIQKSLEGLLDTTANFFKGGKFKELGQKVGNAINLFDLPTLLGKAGTVLSEFVNKSFDLLNGFMEETDWQKLGSDIAEGIKSFLYNVNWDETATNVMTAIGNALSGATGLLSGISANIVMDLPEDWLSDWESGAEEFMKYTQWIRDAISSLGFDLENNTYSFSDFIDNFKTGVDEIASLKDRWVSYWEGIGASFADLDTNSKKHLDANKDNTQSWAEDIADTIEYVKSNWGKADEAIVKAFDDEIKAFDKFKQSLKDGFDAASKNIAEFSVKFVNKIDSIKNGVKDKFTSIKNSIVNVFTSIKSSIEDVLADIGDVLLQWNGFDKFVRYVGSIPDAVKGHADGIKTAIVSALESLPSSIKNIVNQGIGYVEGLINSVIDGFNSIVGVFNKSFKWASKILGNDLFGDGNTATSHVSLPRFDKGGFPDSASIFMANENGVAEMVGQVGNRTAVANNDQIVSAVSDGVSVAVSYVMAEYIPQIINAIMQGKTIEIDGKALAKSVNDVNRTMGKTVYSGGVF